MAEKIVEDRKMTEKLMKTFQKIYPFWPQQMAQKQAEEYLKQLDDRLKPLLERYLTDGIRGDYEQGEFSVLFIQALKHNCEYPDALRLMSEYLKDPKRGKMLILRN